MAPTFIIIEGKCYPWKEILKLRREQRKAARQPQLTLFELKDDCRPASQRTAEGRYSEPMLFSVDYASVRTVPTGSGEGELAELWVNETADPDDPQGADGNSPA